MINNRTFGPNYNNRHYEGKGDYLYMLRFGKVQYFR